MKYIVFSLLTCFFIIQPTWAQDASQQEIFTSKATAQDAQTLITSRYRVTLWGIEAAHVKATPLSLRGRSAMDDLIADKPVKCEVVNKRTGQTFARCKNFQDIDLASVMLEQGFAVVQRQSVIGTSFEQSYSALEQVAKTRKEGIWSDSLSMVPINAPIAIANANEMLPIIVIAVGSSLFTLLLLSLFMLRGFNKIEVLVKKSMALTRSQEDRMRKREKFVVAAMLEGELMANKGKIEAFLVINRDVLSGLNSAKSSGKSHKYQTSTEMVQERPSLARSVFDGNTDKLELLGTQFAKDAVELYNDISADPEYVTLERDLLIDDAINQVQRIVLDAERLLDPIDQLLNALQIVLSDRTRPQVSQIHDGNTMDID
ncbi:MAG: thermonuclease family protein [Pseudomonadota bacterium]